MRSLLTLLILVSVPLQADEHWCATSPENDARVRALHERVRSRSAMLEHATPAAPLEREGAFYVQTDDRIASGYRPVDLDGQSIVFEPRANAKFAVRREALRYVEPTTVEKYDFQPAGASQSIVYDIQGFAFPLFGQPVTRLYLSAFNGIHLTPPTAPGATQFDAVEAAVHRQPLLSPLLITTRKPARLAYPKVFVEENANAVLITWRSTGGESFGYDVQAELRRDGSIVYSYRSLRAMRWGTPIVSSGFDPAAATRRALGGFDDSANDLGNGTVALLGPMANIRRVDVYRINESDLVSVRIRVAAPIDQTKIASGQSLRYIVQVPPYQAQLDIDRNGWSLVPFLGPRAITNGAAVHIDGDTIELYGLQLAPEAASTNRLFAWSYTLPTTTPVDNAFAPSIPFDAPANRVATDLSAVANGSELPLPITEPFILGDFDPLEVWNRLQPAFALSSYDVDAVAMYQSFYTDIIFYAGAYATGGNVQVDGIAPPSSTRGTQYPKAPTLLHMNQFTYGYNAQAPRASQVILHELGHRWLYFFRMKTGNDVTRLLNPVSSHPAAWVNTAAAFPVYGDGESSTMGGAVFTQEGAMFRARVANAGYSWTDLYLMGLATPSEVQPWFYLANTNPALPQEYWPADNVVVSGERRDVTIDQLIAAEGPRNPPTAISQRLFRVLFVLVTEGAEPTAEEVAKLNEWRALLEKNFALATGGRARVTTEWVRAGKKRATR